MSMTGDKQIGVGCGVLVFNDKGEFLLQKRKSKHGFGTYALPGGWLEFMETFEGVAKREVMEEHGVDVENVKVLGVTNNFFPAEDRHTVSIILGARLQKGEEIKIMEPHKCESVAWYNDWYNLPQPLFCEYNKFISQKMIDDYKNGL